jgi:hypothetical protein
LGTDGVKAPNESNKTQIMKIPRLDVFHRKLGMFEMRPPFNYGDTSLVGPQTRGFGYIQDGSFGFPPSADSTLMEFLLVLDTVLAPIVGQQATLDTSAAAAPRVDLLTARAAAAECDLVVKGIVDGESRGFLRGADGTFTGDRSSDAPLDDAAVRALAATPGQPLTYTCAPPGSGRRAAIDRDQDGTLDGDERDSGTNPADAASVPIACTDGPGLAKARLTITRNDDPRGDERLHLRGVLTLPGAEIDPRAHGIGLTITDAAGALVLARIVPAGAAPSKRAAGWTTDRRGRTWTFRDPEGTVAGGVTQVTVRRAAKGRWKLAVKAAGTLRVPPARLPVHLAVALAAAPVDATGRCARTEVAATACTVSEKKGGRLACR